MRVQLGQSLPNNIESRHSFCEAFLVPLADPTTDHAAMSYCNALLHTLLHTLKLCQVAVTTHMARHATAVFPMLVGEQELGCP